MKRILSLILCLIMMTMFCQMSVSAAVVQKNVAKGATVTLYQGNDSFANTGYEGAKMVDGDNTTFTLGKRVVTYSGGIVGASTHLAVIDLGKEYNITELKLSFPTSAEVSAAAESLGYSSYMNANGFNTTGSIVLSKAAPGMSEFDVANGYIGTGGNVLYSGNGFKSQNQIEVTSDDTYRYIALFVPYSYGLAVSEIEVYGGVEIAEDIAIDMHFSSSDKPYDDATDSFGSADLYYTGRVKNETDKAFDTVVLIAGYKDGMLRYIDCCSKKASANDVLNISIPVYKKIGMDEIKGYLWKDDNSPIVAASSVQRIKTEYDPLFDGSVTELQPTVYEAKEFLEEYNQTAETPLPTTGISKFDNVDTIFYDGIKYKGDTKKVWAYVAIPEGASRENPVPGIVLVHGGGGTAYDLWAKLWADKGYAAISIDTEGRMPLSTNTFSIPRDSKQQFTGLGHINNASYNDFTASDSGHSDMWFYQAACDAILAGNVLRGYDAVDSSKIGITGISYGSLVTLTAIGADSRFKFAVPVYGCGHLGEGQTYFAGLMTDARKSWDPSRFYMQSGNMPILWIVSNRDNNFSLDSISSSYLDVYDRATLCTVNNFGHIESFGSIFGATPQGWGLTQDDFNLLGEELLEFVKYSLGDSESRGLAKLSKLSVDGRNITASVKLPDGVSASGGRAVLRYLTYADYSDCFKITGTNGTNWLPGGNGSEQSYNYNWPTTDAQISGGNKISVTAPADATYCYMEYTDSRNMYVTSEMIDLR